MADFAHAGTVICDTYSEDKLIPAFVAKLRELDDESARRFAQSWALTADDMPAEGDDGPCTDGEALAELFTLLEERAPEGWRFGSIEGDGCDFGFWPNEEDEDDA